MLALFWLLPALLFNIDWTGALGWQSNAAAIAMILGSALFFEGSRWAETWLMRSVLIAMAVFMAVGNAMVAFETLSVVGEGRREAREARMGGASQADSQLSQLRTQRAAQVQLAGETASGVYTQELQAIKLREPRRWTATNGCEATKVTSSAAFCIEVTSVQQKLEAATARDALDQRIAKIEARTEGVVVPTSADPLTDNVVSLLGSFGVKLADTRAIVSIKAVIRALGFELLATMGPTCWLMFVAGISGSAAHLAAVATRLRNLSKKRRNADTSPKLANELAKPASPYARWAADALQAGTPSDSLRSGEMRDSWRAWCAAKGEEPGSDHQLWVYLRGCYGHDPNRGRPRYLRVKLQVSGPKLVVVNS